MKKLNLLSLNKRNMLSQKDQKNLKGRGPTSCYCSACRCGVDSGYNPTGHHEGTRKIANPGPLG